jgi:hypothetical protein
MTRRRLIVVVPYLVLTWVFGGWYGALAGTAIVALWLSLGPFGRALWPLSVALLLAAPVATIVKGVPSSSAGGTAGPQHVIAHVLVGLALATVALASMTEITNERTGEHPAGQATRDKPSVESAPDPTSRPEEP